MASETVVELEGLRAQSPVAGERGDGADAAAAIPGRDTGKTPSVEIERYRRPVIKKPLTD